MKNLLAVWIAVLIFASCSDHYDLQTLDRDLKEVTKEKTLLTQQDHNMINMAVGIVKASNNNTNFTRKIKAKVDERFDGDYNVLLSSIRGENIGNNTRSMGGEQTFESCLLSHVTPTTKASQNILDALIEHNPNVQIAVPVHADKWDGVSPLKVAILPEDYDEKTTKFIPCVDLDGTLGEIDAVTPPTEPVMVLSYNERSGIIVPVDKDPAGTQPRRPILEVTQGNIGITIICHSGDIEISPDYCMLYRVDQFNEEVELGKVYTERPFTDNTVTSNEIYSYYAYAFRDGIRSLKSRSVSITAPSYVSSAIASFSARLRTNDLVELILTYRDDVVMDNNPYTDQSPVQPIILKSINQVVDSMNISIKAFNEGKDITTKYRLLLAIKKQTPREIFVSSRIKTSTVMS